MAPIVLTGLLTMGTCVLIRQPLNFANIIALPLLFGIGVAFHIQNCETPGSDGPCRRREIVPVENSVGGKRVSVPELRAAVDRVLADPSYANNAQRFGQQLRSYGGAPRAAELIETFTKGLSSPQ
jgi:hypothetical protein